MALYLLVDWLKKTFASLRERSGQCVSTRGVLEMLRTIAFIVGLLVIALVALYLGYLAGIGLCFLCVNGPIGMLLALASVLALACVLAAADYWSNTHV